MPKPCQCNRWGTGTTCEPSQWKTGTNKELDTKLQQMMAERAKLDTLWTQPQSQSSEKSLIPNDPKYTQGQASQKGVNGLSRS